MSMKIIVNDVRFRRCPKMAGNSHRTFYSKSINHLNGNSIYKERDSVNIQDDINSYADSCSLEKQLLRLSMAPVDAVISALHTKDTFSADLSHIPTNLMDFFELKKSISKDYPDFDKLYASGMSDVDIIKKLIPSLDISKEKDVINTEVNNDGKNE